MEDTYKTGVAGKLLPAALGALIALAGLGLALGGARLLILGGSAYYALAGLAGC